MKVANKEAVFGNGSPSREEISFIPYPKLYLKPTYLGCIGTIEIFGMNFKNEIAIARPGNEFLVFWYK